MSDLQLIDAVAHVTGEDALEIRRRGFVLTGPEDSRSNPEPECLLDVMLVDLRKRARSTGTRSALGAVSRSSRARSRPGRRVGQCANPRRHPASRSPARWVSCFMLAGRGSFPRRGRLWRISSAAARWEARTGNRFIYEACSRLTVITSSAASGSIADSGTVTVAIESPNALNTSSTQPRSPPAGCST